MSPPRRGGTHGRGDADGAPDLDALRARMEEAGRAGERPKRSKRPRGARAGHGDEAVEPEPTDDDWPPRRWWKEGEGGGTPIPVVGGIAARTRKGPIGATWWSRRFLDALEAVMVGGRMERGRSYARKGQVVDLEVRSGVVQATVQGSRPEPYRVELAMPVVPPQGWDRIVRSLADQAGYAARMLAGDLPHEVEGVFAAEGESLFPAPHARLVTACTCPDWENPCKHIAAVCYLLAEGFDSDPFSLLAWRGRGRGEILHELRVLRGAPSPAAPLEPSGASPSEDEPVDGTPLGETLEFFWDAGPELAHVKVRPQEAALPAAALRLAARGVITVQGRDLVDVLAPAYAAIAAAAARRAQG